MRGCPSPQPQEDRLFAFTSDLATLVADQLERFVTLNPDQLAGQVANLDFWLDQARNALQAIDGYGVRFIQMEGAQDRHIAARDTFQTRKARRVPDRELQKPRRAVLAAVERFLARCRAERLISDDQCRAARQFLKLDDDTR